MCEILAKKKFFMFAEKHSATEEAKDYESVLKRKKAATSERAWDGRLRTLVVFTEKGHDPKAIIALSADSGWTGLFEPRMTNGKSNGTRESTVQRQNREIREAIERADGIC